MTNNANQCNIIPLSCKKTCLNKLYNLDGVPLAHTQEPKYLDVLITSDLKWSSHISAFCAKAGKTLSFMWRNLRHSPEEPLHIPAWYDPCWSTLPQCGTLTYKKIPRLLRQYSDDRQDLLRTYLAKTTSASPKYCRNYAGQPSREGESKDSVCSINLYKVAMPVPDYLSPSDTRTLARHDQTFKVLQAKTTQFKNSFLPRTLTDWNSLIQKAVDSPQG
jgi:hypothetical protein